jgi:hypothetical protein
MSANIKIIKSFLSLSVSLIIPFVLFSSIESWASELVYTIQTGSYVGEKDALKHFEYVAQRLSEIERSYLRVEKVGNYYTVRFGRFESYTNANNLKQAVTAKFPDAVIISAYIKENRHI